MKDDEKKSQREEMQFPDEDDMDFEILDALEQLDQSGSGQSPDISDDSIELTLDDDMSLGENISEAGGGFSFDDSLREGLEQELLQGGADFNLDDSLEDDLVKEIQAESGETSFDSGLDLENEFSAQATDAESDASEFDMSAAETLAFKFNKQNSTTGLDSEENEGLGDLGSYDLDFGDEGDELNLDDFSDGDDDFPDLDLGIEGVEISEEFADLGADIDLESGLDLESDDDEIHGKAVIAVGDDEVIDLGDEVNIQQAQPPEAPVEEEEYSMPEAEEEAVPELPAEEAEEEEVPSVPEIALDLHEDDDAEDFMSSIDDIDIDFGDDDDLPDDLGSLSDEDGMEDIPADTEETDMADLVSEVLKASETDEDDDMDEMQNTEEEDEPVAGDISDGEPVDEDTPAEEDILEENVPVEEEIDVREFLGLSLRLSDEQIEEFEGMVGETKTLQTYLDELEEHQSDVNGTIYQKLQVEYVARKTVIFKSSEFTTLLADVERDLEDMLGTRSEFVSTVQRLNEELEEIKVRHLVGEYDDSTLADKQDFQNAEIALWNEKTEKIEVFITRYQESLDVEKALNPLRQEQIESPMEEEDQPVEEVSEVEDSEELAETPDAETEEDIEPGTADQNIEAPLADEDDAEEEESFPDMEKDVAEDEESFPETEEEADDEEMTEESSVPPLETEPEEAPEPVEDESDDGDEIEDFFTGDDDGLEEDDEEFPLDGDFGTGDFVLDDLSGFEEDDEDEDAEIAVDYDVEGVGNDDAEAAPQNEDMVACTKCGRQTPAAEKFCAHCGGKAQKAAAQNANVSCKKCGRETPAAEKFCTHCGGKAQ